VSGRVFKSLLVLLAWVGGVRAGSALPPVEIEPARDLAREAGRAGQGCRPLLLEFAAESCEYCALLEEEILKPLLRNRDYDSRVLIRRVILDDGSELTGFDGKPLSSADLADDYDVFVTPTLVFVDSRGRELAERMVGVTTLEMYGGYLDRALDRAAEKLRSEGRCKP